MIVHSKMTIDWLNVIADEPTYSVMFTSRGEVTSPDDPYAGFNICHYTGDDMRHVEACRRELIEKTGVNDWVIPRQTHSTSIRIINEFPVEQSAIDGVDGLVTRLKGVAIGVSTADCAPVIMVDSYAGIIGAVHAGWRGAVNGIVANGVSAMLSLGARAERIKVYFGPAICVDCFEVGEEVADCFPAECVRRFSNCSRPHVDLPAFVCHELLRCGLLQDNIKEFDRNLCTRCRPDRYFSARYSGVNSGRNFTFAVLK